MSDDQEDDEDRDPPRGQSPEPRTIKAVDLFQGGREICIDHAGTIYRLRITRRNKLILNR